MLAPLLVALALLLPIPPQARPADSLASAIEALARPRIERGESVGIVVGVVRDGKTEVFGFGRPSVEDDEPPDGRTIFEIGSITKVFTAITLADMAREGLVRLDDPVASLLPEGTRIPERDGRAITLRTLANHTSGLPTVFPKVIGRSIRGLDPYDGVTPRDVYDFLATCDLPRAPGEKYAYSNLGAGLLGTALARRAGTSYEDLVVSRIARPLGMVDTRVTLDPARALRLARPYKKDGKPSIYWKFDAIAGAGALRSTADDMLRFALANLEQAPAPDRLREAMAEARRPATSGPVERLKVGLGWHVNEAGPRPEVVWHNGGTGGFRSFLGLVPARKVAVVVLSNSDAEVDSLGLAVLARLAPE